MATKHSSLDLMSNRRSFESTPLIDAVLEGVQETMTGWNRPTPTLAELLEWVFLDIGFYAEDVPASGRYSPVLRSILIDAYGKVGGKPGDMDDKGRPYRGRYSERTLPLNV